jgi:hypothetical protein
VSIKHFYLRIWRNEHQRIQWWSRSKTLFYHLAQFQSSMVTFGCPRLFDTSHSMFRVRGEICDAILKEQGYSRPRRDGGAAGRCDIEPSRPHRPSGFRVTLPALRVDYEVRVAISNARSAVCSFLVCLPGVGLLTSTIRLKLHQPSGAQYTVALSCCRYNVNV